jgi:hypothetical protein
MFPDVSFSMAGGSHGLKEMARSEQEGTATKYTTFQSFLFISVNYLRGMTSSLRILSNLAFVSHPTI